MKMGSADEDPNWEPVLASLLGRKCVRSAGSFQGVPSQPEAVVKALGFEDSPSIYLKQSFLVFLFILI